MKIAMLVLAHKNFDQTLRLVQRLQDSQIDIYIHLDKKWKLSEQETTLLKQYTKVLEERISCGLDSATLVEAELNLLKQASKGKYQYYCLISGQDYPICTNTEIIEKLSEIYPKSLIDVTPYARRNWVWFKFNASVWYKKKNTAINKRWNNRLIKKAIKILYLIWDIVIIQKGNTLYKKLINKGITPYGGSEWWILSDLAVQELLDLITKEKDICTLIKQGFTPDEIFFQTLFMRTKYATDIVVNKPMECERRCGTYIDFGGKERTKSAHPYVLTIQDRNKLLSAKKKGYLFARKFDINEDSEILDYLDHMNRM